MASPPLTHKNRSVLVKGKARGLSCSLLALEPTIRHNVWEICISSVSVNCANEPTNYLLGIKSNYVHKSTYLALVSFSGKSEKNQTIYLPQNWFEIDYVEDSFDLSIIDMNTHMELMSQDTFHVHVMYHRKA